MAFEALSDRLQGIFKKIRGQSELTEKNMEEVTQEIYVALLEADVNVKVARICSKTKNKNYRNESTSYFNTITNGC